MYIESESDHHKAKVNHMCDKCPVSMESDTWKVRVYQEENWIRIVLTGKHDHRQRTGLWQQSYELVRRRKEDMRRNRDGSLPYRQRVRDDNEM